jgi:chromosome partitioning protein
METTAVGWQGPAPVETDPVGWIGVSRETSPPVPQPAVEEPAPPASGGAAPEATADAQTESTPESTHEPPSDEIDAAERADFSAGVLTAADLAARPTSDEESNPPLAQSVAEAQRRAARAPLPHPDVTRVFVVANQKGGVGKTTTAVNIAAVLAQHGQRVLLVDLDPQGNASTAVGVDHTEGTPSAYQVLISGMPIADVVAVCPDVDGLMVVPATIDLAGAEIELVSLVARETRLRKALETYLTAEEAAGRRYDYVFIDCPPSLGLLTVNSLSAGRQMLIPIQCEYYALEGVSQLLRTLDQVREHLNPDLDLGRIVLTMFDGRTRLAAGVADEVRAHFGERVLKTAIPRSVRISEAPSYGQTVLTYDPASPGAISYLDAALELADEAGSKESV